MRVNVVRQSQPCQTHDLIGNARRLCPALRGLRLNQLEVKKKNLPTLSDCWGVGWREFRALFELRKVHRDVGRALHHFATAG